MAILHLSGCETPRGAAAPDLRIEEAAGLMETTSRVGAQDAPDTVEAVPAARLMVATAT